VESPANLAEIARPGYWGNDSNGGHCPRVS